MNAMNYADNMSAVRPVRAWKYQTLRFASISAVSLATICLLQVGVPPLAVVAALLLYPIVAYRLFVRRHRHTEAAAGVSSG